MIMIACYIVYIVCTDVKFLFKPEILAFRRASVKNGAEACDTRFRHKSW